MFYIVLIICIFNVFLDVVGVFVGLGGWFLGLYNIVVMEMGLLVLMGKVNKYIGKQVDVKKMYNLL